MRRLLSAVLLSLAATAASATTYTIDPNHTQVHFTYGHQGYAHLSGRFTQVSGTIEYDAAAPARASVDVTLPIAALSTGFPRLDTHMQSADMFDAEKFPNATFKSTRVEVAGERLRVSGDLTIHGVTRPVTFDARINSTAPRRNTPKLGLDATATIKRSEFGVDFSLPGVPDEIELRIGLEASGPAPAPAPAPAAAPGKSG